MSNASAHSLYYKKENYQTKDLKKKNMQSCYVHINFKFCFPNKFLFNYFEFNVTYKMKIPIKI